MKLVLPYPPTANNFKAPLRGRNGGKLKFRLTKAAREYKDACAIICMASRVKPLEGWVLADIKVYRPRKAGDLDNALKLPLDTIKGFAYFDDSQVRKILAELFDDAQNPRVEISVCPYEQTT